MFWKKECGFRYEFYFCGGTSSRQKPVRIVIWVLLKKSEEIHKHTQTQYGSAMSFSFMEVQVIVDDLGALPLVYLACITKPTNCGYT